MNSDIVVRRAVDGLLHVLEEYGVQPDLRKSAAEHCVDALRNVMSVSDSQRVIDDIRSRPSP